MRSSGFVVLVVEDDVFTRIDVAGAFEASGWTVLEAASGKSALELCGSDTQVDLLITDIDLGSGPTGWDVARSFWRRDALPVIYVSANPDAPHRHVPQSRFVAKPCSSSALVEACERLHEGFWRRKSGRDAGGSSDEAAGPA